MLGACRFGVERGGVVGDERAVGADEVDEHLQVPVLVGGVHVGSGLVEVVEEAERVAHARGRGVDEHPASVVGVPKEEPARESSGAVTTIATPINNSDVAFVGTTNSGAFRGDSLTTTPNWISPYTSGLSI